MASNNSSTPGPKIQLNLDTLTREQVRGVPKPKPEPFAISIEGRPLVFIDPIEIDAPVLMRMEETPERFFRAALSTEDADWFLNDVFFEPGKMPGWRLSAIMQGYQDYYGLDAQGNARGSRR